MSPLSGKSRRQQHILDLLSRNQVESQDELMDLLLAEGVRTTQSTLSRDLREMGVLKGSTGYRVPHGTAVGPDRVRALAGTVSSKLVSVDRGDNLVVLRASTAEDAKLVAEAIELAELHQVTAALVCENAVLVVARTQAYAREIVRGLRERPRRRFLRRGSLE